MFNKHDKNTEYKKSKVPKVVQLKFFFVYGYIIANLIMILVE